MINFSFCKGPLLQILLEEQNLRKKNPHSQLYTFYTLMFKRLSETRTLNLNLLILLLISTGKANSSVKYEDFISSENFPQIGDHLFKQSEGNQRMTCSFALRKQNQKTPWALPDFFVFLLI